MRGTMKAGFNDSSFYESPHGHGYELEFCCTLGISVAIGSMHIWLRRDKNLRCPLVMAYEIEPLFRC